MKRFLTGVLSGILSFGSVNSTYAQNIKPNTDVLKAADEEDNKRHLSLNSQKIINDKVSIDYLVESFLPPVLYSHISNTENIFVNTASISKDLSESEFTLDTNIKIFSNAGIYDSEIFGYECNNDIFNLRLKGLSKRNISLYKYMSSIKFQGTLANKPISYTVNKNGELPVDASGEWGDLEIKVAYTPATNVKWLIDHADVGLYKLGTKELVAKYRIDYQQGERKVQAGTAIGYKGFTVTKQ